MTLTVDLYELLLSVLQNPDYMKDGFHITIETIHVENDRGQQNNVSVKYVMYVSWEEGGVVHACTMWREGCTCMYHVEGGVYMHVPCCDSSLIMMCCLLLCRSTSYQRGSWKREMLFLWTLSMMMCQVLYVIM